MRIRESASLGPDLRGIFWLPVVWIQKRMREFAIEAIKAVDTLPRGYHRLFGIWFAFAFQALTSVLVIICLTITRSLPF